MLTGLLPRAAATPPASGLYQARALHESYHSCEQISRKRFQPDDSSGSPMGRHCFPHQLIIIMPKNLT